MQIIPFHRTISKPVCLDNFQTLEPEIRMMQDFLETGRSGSNVIRKPNPFALHHSQVSRNPYHVFVIKRALIEETDPHFVVAILNAKILDKEKSSRTVVQEGCLSFPDRGDKKVRRYLNIQVSFDVPYYDKETGSWKFEHEEEFVTGAIAQIFQHEIQPAAGKSIYDK